MRKAAFGRVLCALLLGVVSCVAIAQEASAPVFKEGDYWKYTRQDLGNKREPFVFTNIVSKIESGQAVVFGETGPPTGSKFWWIYDFNSQNWVARHAFDDAAPGKRGAMTYDGSRSEPQIKFPLTVGKKYEHTDVWRNSSNGDTGSSATTASVVALEKVSTAAGTFDAYKIEMDGRWRNDKWGSSGRVTRTIWYAPAVKRQVKFEFKDWDQRGQVNNHYVEELQDFKPGS